MVLNGKKTPKRRKKRIKLSPKASRVLKVLKGVALRFSWAARLVIGAVLFTPILVYMVYINSFWLCWLKNLKHRPTRLHSALLEFCK